MTGVPSRSPYASGLGPNAVNNAPLTPVSFLLRTAEVYPERLAVVHGRRRFTWAQFLDRCRRLAGALNAAGIGAGDTVAVMAANTPEMLEAHFGVPMSGAVLNALNIRLDAKAVAFMLGHAEAKALIADTEFSKTVREALALLGREILVIDIDDDQGPGGERLGAQDYGQFMATGGAGPAAAQPADEWQPIALNYTSGTTGNPKGVVYHHRGAYLLALSNMIDWGMPRHAVMLWTLPLFHCNGWGFAWTMAANAGTSICLRRFDAEQALAAIREHRVTHYCGAPIVHAMLAGAPGEGKRGIAHRVSGLIGGAPPPVPLIEQMQRMNVDITQIYGLTEVFGPAAVCAEPPEWRSLGIEALAERKGRQGVRYTAQEGMTVMDPRTMTPVPRDGRTVGEIMFRGNMTMLGYLKNPAATQAAFAGGWFHSGDLAVVQPDGYARIRDRSSDVIISGGENISSVEVEEVLYRHPDVLAAAVVARPDAKWGETPCAFVELKEGATATGADLVAHCREHLARYKAPRTVVVGPLPRTSTGKVQKFALRAQAAALPAGDQVTASRP